MTWKLFELASLRHLEANLKNPSKQLYSNITLSFTLLLYINVSKVTPIHSLNIYFTSNICCKDESEGKQRGGKWEERCEEKKEELKEKCWRAEHYLFLTRRMKKQKWITKDTNFSRKKSVFTEVIFYCHVRKFYIEQWWYTVRWQINDKRMNKNIPIIPPQNKRTDS